MNDRRFVFVLGSTRADGNSERLAREAARALPATASQRWLRLVDDPLPPFFDTRHDGGYPPLRGAGRRWADATLDATDLVLVTPVNWYTVAWPMKLYLDHWTAWLREPSVAFADTMAGRSLWAVVVDSDDDDSGSARPTVDTLRRTASYLRMRWRGALVGHGNRPGEVLTDSVAMTRARSYFAEGTPDGEALR